MRASWSLPYLHSAIKFAEYISIVQILLLHTCSLAKTISQVLSRSNNPSIEMAFQSLLENGTFTNGHASPDDRCK